MKKTVRFSRFTFLLLLLSCAVGKEAEKPAVWRETVSETGSLHYSTDEASCAVTINSDDSVVVAAWQQGAPMIQHVFIRRGEIERVHWLEHAIPLEFWGITLPTEIFLTGPELVDEPCVAAMWELPAKAKWRFGGVYGVGRKTNYGDI